MRRWVKIITATFVVTAVLVATTEAQITAPRILSASPDRFVKLQEQLINRLRATTEDKQAYIRRLVALVRNKKLDVKLVVAIERKALQSRPAFPFPYFEQAIKIEAAKRNVRVPTVVEFEAAQATGPNGAIQRLRNLPGI
jgi:hypothetical protein